MVKRVDTDESTPSRFKTEPPLTRLLVGLWEGSHILRRVLLVVYSIPTRSTIRSNRCSVNHAGSSLTRKVS